MQGTRVDDPHRPCTRNVAAATHPGDSAGQRQHSTLKAVEVGADGLAYTRMYALRLGTQNPAPTAMSHTGLWYYYIVREKDTWTGGSSADLRGGGAGAAHRRQGQCRRQLPQGVGTL